MKKLTPWFLDAAAMTLILISMNFFQWNKNLSLILIAIFLLSHAEKAMIYLIVKFSKIIYKK